MKTTKGKLFNMNALEWRVKEWISQGYQLMPQMLGGKNSINLLINSNFIIKTVN